MTRDEFQEVIDFAIKREEGAAELYVHAKNMATSQDAKNMFAELFAEEKKHKELLEGLEPESVQQKPVQTTPDLKISDYLVAMKFDPNMNYQDILILAMKREEQSVRLYTDMGNKIDDPQLQNLFRTLASEEAKHKNKLETEYDENVLRDN